MSARVPSLIPFRKIGAADFHSCYFAKSSPLPFFTEQSAHSEIHEHLVTLHMLTVEHSCRRILEVGTGNGQSTIALAYAAKAIGGKVTTMDIEDCVEARQLVVARGLRSYVEFQKQDSRTYSRTGPIDHLFIDSSHEYDATLEELKRLEPLVTTVITMHDSISVYHNDERDRHDVRNAVFSYFRGREDVRMYEYLNNNGLFVIFKNRLGVKQAP